VREPKASEQAEQRVRNDIDRVELGVRKGKVRGARISVARRPSVKLPSANPRPTAGRGHRPAIRKKTRRG